MPAEERRIDPEDGLTQTLPQLRKKYAGRYGQEDIDEYWHTTCMPVEGSPGGGNDPFLSHAGQQPRPPPSEPEARMESVRENPFLTHQAGDMGARPAEANLREDPFMTHGQYVSQDGRDSYREGAHRARRQQLIQAAATLRRGWQEALQNVLGPGAPDRKLPARNALILGPWLTFMWIVLVWILLQHFSLECCVLLTAALSGLSCIMIFAWFMGKRWGPVSLLPLGALCLLAVGMGAVVGHEGWHRHWRQYWWLQTGLRTTDTSGSTPAAARSDSSVIGFNTAAGPAGRTVVDDMRSAGYKEEHFYCVAPVLNPQAAGASLAIVNYWAVGIDCCSELGRFSCDASRSFKGGFGVVMLDGGFPCPGCHADKFRAAVAKAEAMHGLVSAPGAIYLRWVSDVPGTELATLLGALTFILLSAVWGFLAFFALGSLAWYWGIGNRGAESGALLDSAGRPKQTAI